MLRACHSTQHVSLSRRSLARIAAIRLGFVLGIERQSPARYKQPTLIFGTRIFSSAVEGVEHATAGSMREADSAGTPLTQPPRRQVVTAWVQRADGRVAVVKRSGEVNSYQFKWGGISGGVEGDEPLLLRCVLEIEEEISIPRDRLELVRAGRPQLVGDGNRRFAVHPFLFRLLGEDVPPLTLNWESVEARWVSAEEMQELDSVPGLPETLQRVVVSQDEERHLARFAEDREHGAAQMAGWVLDALEEWAAGHEQREGGAGCASTAMTALRNYAYHLACVRPSMAAVAGVAVDVVVETDSCLRGRADAFETDAGHVWDAVLEACQKLRRNSAEARDRLLGHAAEQLLGFDTIMTLSFSSTLLEALRHRATVSPLHCIVCESRPLFEGVALARELTNAGARVTVITDAQAVVWAARADAALVGADAITPAGVHNKVGTYALALAAQTAAKPVYALADTGKVSPGPIARLAHPGAYVSGGEGEAKDPAELTRSWGEDPEPMRFEVSNVYFESTPVSLFAGIITEGGTLAQQDVVSLEKDKLARALDAFQLEAAVPEPAQIGALA